MEEQFYRAVGALAQLVVLSMVLERGLAFIFEHDWFRMAFMKMVPDPSDPTRTIRESRIPGLRGTLALIASFAVCRLYRFDVLAALFGRPESDMIGITITGIVAAGGSAGAIAIFQGFLNLNRDSREALLAAKKAEAQASAEISRSESEAKKAVAEAEKAQADARRKEAEAISAKAEEEKKRAASGEGK